jgi:glycerol uptake facilitator-like aquaporin
MSAEPSVARRRLIVTSIPEQHLVQRYEQSLVDTFTNFQDPSQEWRRLFSELLGTFFLVLVAAGGGMMGQAFPTRSAARQPSSRPG